MSEQDGVSESVKSSNRGEPLSEGNIFQIEDHQDPEEVHKLLDRLIGFRFSSGKYRGIEFARQTVGSDEVKGLGMNGIPDNVVRVAMLPRHPDSPSGVGTSITIDSDGKVGYWGRYAREMQKPSLGSTPDGLLQALENNELPKFLQETFDYISNLPE